MIIAFIVTFNSIVSTIIAGNVLIVALAIFLVDIIANSQFSPFLIIAISFTNIYIYT